ncbi:hypothetical protein U9M48_004696 [Paspalum notatum var. saurae]|uniref:Uncharacterized protein n=1 Tax=Paspalum notatum var. saurae TaxID=547442 RepID=A0AAQ3PKW4_PASNO
MAILGARLVSPVLTVASSATSQGIGCLCAPWRGRRVCRARQRGMASLGGVCWALYRGFVRPAGALAMTINRGGLLPRKASKAE